ncbi:MAG: VacB/RNase II family 3'-5' exoribonuclease [Proteobacteria bacterium]|nr:VacB/RNase II family 3'-5' exoribonuclease [Pseudomonadota bacterium]
MNITEKKIREVLDTVGEGLTIKELLLALNFRKKKTAHLKIALRNLERKKLCIRQNDQYFPTERTPADSERAKDKSASSISSVSSEGNFSSRMHAPKGIFLMENGEGVVFSFESNEKYPLNRLGMNNLLHGDTVDFYLESEKHGKKSVHITRIVDRKIELLKGKLIPGKKGRLFFSPKGSFFPRRIKVHGSRPGKENFESEVMLRIARPPANGRDPEGQVDSFLSLEAFEKRSIVKILSENGIAAGFTAKVLKNGSRFQKAVRLKKGENRKDLRRLPFVTIDGDDAKDFDDAIYAEEEGSGFRIWVSIADVAEYVKTGSELDREAFSRGTSTYLPGTVYPMLPEILSQGLCSLKEGVNRKTLTCEILLDRDGRVLNFEIYESINRIVRRLTYETVDRFFETGTMNVGKSPDGLGSLLTLYGNIAEVLDRKRRRRGVIDFCLPETRFEYDGRDRLVDIRKTYQTKTMKVIEQFMLEANENVGRFCDRHKIPIIWRNHPPPLPEKLIDLRRLFWECGFKIPVVKTSRDLDRALEEIKDASERELLEYGMLRSMSLACYGTEREGHFGLAASHYCHFTSPIRRYPDLVVHRAIKAFLSRRKMPFLSEYIAGRVSEKEQLAVSAERSAEKLKKMLFMTDRIGEVFKVKISGLHWKGLFVEVEHPFVEGFVPFKTIYDDIYEYDGRNRSVLGRNSHRNVGVGTELKAVLARLDLKNRSPEFDWICWIGKDDGLNTK